MSYDRSFDILLLFSIESFCRQYNILEEKDAVKW